MPDEVKSPQDEHGNSIVLIERLWFTQARLKRLEQMPDLITYAHNGGVFNRAPFIELHQNEDEEIVINNGHHRVTAVWLAGRAFLSREEFVLFYKDAHRPRFGTIDIFLKRLPTETLAWLRQIECADQALRRLKIEKKAPGKNPPTASSSILLHLTLLSLSLHCKNPSAFSSEQAC